MNKFILVVLVITGCSTQDIVGLNTVRQEIEPITDINCAIANQIDRVINPNLISTTQDICTVIKATRVVLDSTVTIKDGATNK